MELRHFDYTKTIPAHLAAEVRLLLEAEWPGADEEDHSSPSLIEPELHPVYFMLTGEHQVLSYARTIWLPVSHVGLRLKLYGLGDVITQPAFRRKGYSWRIVEAATTYIKTDPDADAGLLLTTPNLAAFYQRSGWQHVPGLRVVTDERDSNAAGTAFPMMLFLSAKARAAREAFPRKTLVLPGDEW